MAYPTVAAPYGLKPVNMIGGQVFNHGVRRMPIASGSATAIYYGDIVKLINTGTIEKDTGTDAATPVGVFLGVSYTDADFGKVFKQYYPGGISQADIEAYVIDDPDALFKIAVVSATTTIGGVAQTAVGNNGVLVQNAGSTATGNSKVAVSATTATTSTWPVRIVDVIPETANASGSFTEVVVKWNAGMHQYENATGV